MSLSPIEPPTTAPEATCLHQGMAISQPHLYMFAGPAKIRRAVVSPHLPFAQVWRASRTVVRPLVTDVVVTNDLQSFSLPLSWVGMHL